MVSWFPFLGAREMTYGNCHRSIPNANADRQQFRISNERGRSRMSRTISSCHSFSVPPDTCRRASPGPCCRCPGGGKRGSVNVVGQVNKVMTGGTGPGLVQIRGISAVVKRSVRVGGMKSNVGECQPDGHLEISSSFFGCSLFLAISESEMRETDFSFLPVSAIPTIWDNFAF